MTRYLIGQGIEFYAQAYEDPDDADPIDSGIYTLYVTLPNLSEAELPNVSFPIRLDTQTKQYIIEYTPPSVGEYSWYWQMVGTEDDPIDAADKGTFTVYGRSG